jgi:shikimate dehydrogenase
MRTFGLVGASLAHSFSPKFFETYFRKQQIEAEYKLFEITSINEINSIFQQFPAGLNVTIPYKETVLPYLDEIHHDAKMIGAVNTIAFHGKRTIGYNTDCIGFRQSIKPFLTLHHERAMVIGTGGSAKAIAWTLKNIGIDVLFISRTPNHQDKIFSYDDINPNMVNACKLIVNCTPVGMYPNETSTIVFPFSSLCSDHLVIDLIYNPEETIFLREAKKYGACILNGESMLKHQALASWEIWNYLTKA